MNQGEITLPFNYIPRDYQIPTLEALDNGIKRVVMVWHRRSGKEKTLINYTARAMDDRIGTYFYLFPTYAQAKKAIWDGKDREGFPFRSHFHAALVKNMNSTELKIEYKNGSIFQLVGTDNIDTLMSTNPIGCVFAEYSLQDPAAWEFIRPILLENGGWAAFDYTPRGKNHAYDLYEMARNNPDWFVSRLTVEDTKRPDGTPVITQAMIESERREGVSEEMIQQEYYCLRPDTRVLTAGLEWVAIDSLVDNRQDLIGVDELGSSNGGRRKLRRAKVTDAWRTIKDCYRIEFADGRSVVSSLEHPWLVQNIGPQKWVETRHLSVGDCVSNSGLKPWEADRSYEAGWLAGLYDGEGCVSRRTVSVAQLPGAVLDSAIGLLADKEFRTFSTMSKGCQSVWCSLHESIRLLGVIRPQRLLLKAESIWGGAYPFNGVPALRIVSISDVGASDVVGISTSTKTFIAEGLITHNCSFEGVMEGSYYGKQLDIAKKEGRIGRMPYDPALGVETWWDIGIGDATAIWFTQTIRNEIHVIDYLENSGEMMSFYAKELQLKPYIYIGHHGPHDLEVREWAQAGAEGEPKTRKQIAKALGIDFQLVPNLGIDDGIEAARAIMSRCYFDAEKCKRGLSALSSYHKAYNTKTKTFQSYPEHDWSSNGCDGFRYFAVGHKSVKLKLPKRSGDNSSSATTFMAN